MLRRFLSRRKNRRVAALNASTVNGSRSFAPVLERERARADRSGYELSLVLLGLDDKPSRTELALEKLVDTIRHRCRITDEIGVFDKQTAFALLPDTDAKGARHFADTIQAVMKRHSIKTSYAVYSYGTSQSSKRKPPKDGDSGHGGGSRQGDTDVAVARRIPRNRPARPTVPMAAEARREEPIQDLKTAFVRPLPLWKRVIDLSVAGPMLVILWPLLVTIGLAIRLESKGPAVFKQERTGLGGRPFWIFKFRTMVDGAEGHRNNLLHINEHKGPAFKIKNDPRVTRLGTFLRKSSLDELPQLINVIRGEMTLVGPRPLPVYEADGCEDWQRRRVEVTPGLTCIWQVSGRSEVDFDDWVRMDLTYQKSRTFSHDMRILMQTVPAVFAQRGAH